MKTKIRRTNGRGSALRVKVCSIRDRTPESKTWQDRYEFLTEIGRDYNGES